METREDSSPRPRIPFDLDWVDAFDYPAGNLTGRGPWIDSPLTSVTAILTAAGHVQSPGGGIGGNVADDAFENFDPTRPWSLTIEFFIAAAAGTANGISLYMGSTSSPYCGLGLGFGSLVYAGAFGQLAQDGPTGGTPSNPDGPADKTPILLGAINTIEIRHKGANKVDFIINGSTQWLDQDFDMSTIAEPYPEFDFQSDQQPGKGVLRSMRVFQSNQ